jgi:hypothetical protein
VVLDPSGLDLEEIGNVLADQTDYEHRWLINPRTGEIVFWTADTGIDGQTPAWYTFRDTRAKRRAVQWLADNSLVDDEAASRLLTGYPDPDLP